MTSQAGPIRPTPATASGKINVRAGTVKVGETLVELIDQAGERRSHRIGMSEGPGVKHKDVAHDTRQG